ncbi:MAG: HAD-IC family P-type ATPase [Ketobacteraceae bacterium]|nr:HAD-IC family P-type ATPase [Ketobacteraceae bacterium]
MRKDTATQSPMPDPDFSAHAQPIVAVADRLGVQADTGLSGEEASRRLRQQGPNVLAEVPPRSPWQVFISQFRSLLILILIGAACLAAFIGNLKDAIVIFVVVLINCSVGFYQEYRAERSLAALRSMLPARTRVRREGRKHEIRADELVPGDIVLLEAGDHVPADGRLMVAAGLEADESALTGESQPVAKDETALVEQQAAIGDRSNMLYMNTMVTRGRAEMLVTATGVHTEMGRLSEELAITEEPPTPLQLQLDSLGKRLGLIALVLVALLAYLEWLRGDDITEIMLAAIALGVAAIPEGLPVVVTVTLALGMQKMARQKAIVKRLASVETLGCTTVICSDKTGTLTLNQMTARAFYFHGRRFTVTGEGYSPRGDIQANDGAGQLPDFSDFLIPLVTCNDSNLNDGKVVGDPMEGALLVLAQKGGLSLQEVRKQVPRDDEVPFDAAHKFMATFHRDGQNVRMYVKGAPDVLLARCSHWLAEDGPRAMDDAERQAIDAEYIALADEGLRGLLIAERVISEETFKQTDDLIDLVQELSFTGLVGLMDPPRPEAREAIAKCNQAGIAVKMITGDHKSTGAAIARELGLEGDAITGAELDQLDDTALAKIIDSTVVFARVSPSHKVKIVRALQARGHVVAMTGDGVNDAPALKGADIGVAMGITGTAVSKEAATMVLVDDNFATIVKAVQGGRTLYDNILKFVRFQLSTTIGAILTVFCAPLAGLPEPFTPVQILWVAIIMDGPPAISLALDAARPGIMEESPRPRSAAILPLTRLARIVAYGVTMMVGTLAVLYYGTQTGSEQRALTLAFTTFVLFQVFNVFNARNERGSSLNRNTLDNGMLWLSLVVVVALQALAVHWAPAQAVFGIGGMEYSDWLIAIGVSASVLVLEESRKLIWSVAGFSSGSGHPAATQQ